MPEKRVNNEIQLKQLAVEVIDNENMMTQSIDYLNVRFNNIAFAWENAENPIYVSIEFKSIFIDFSEAFPDGPPKELNRMASISFWIIT